MAVKRFASHSENEILEKRSNVVPKNTSKANKKCANMLREYLREKNDDVNFEEFTLEKINDVLEHFYLDARKVGGEQYKTSSLENFRYGLNRYLKAPPFLKPYDIIKDRGFHSSNEVFKTALCELKSLGKGDVTHYPPIEKPDIQRLYGSIHLSSNTPYGLLNKVQLDIRLYFCRRGGENMADMTRDTFVCETSVNTGMKFVRKQKDELCKNRRENNKENFGGYMPEIAGSPYCPVESFLKYISKLNPDNEKLWQRPLASFRENDSVWYTKQAVGKDSLSSFMSKLSKFCNLSQVYTNHSVRATGTTILARNNFSDAQIMSVTGHKSSTSLVPYHGVSSEEKFAMGRVINETVSVNPESLPASRTLPSISSNGNDLGMSNSTGEIIPDDLLDINIDDLFAELQEFEETNVTTMKNTNLAKQTVNISRTQTQPFSSMFQNCKIGKVEINFNKL